LHLSAHRLLGGQNARVQQAAFVDPSGFSAELSAIATGDRQQAANFGTLTAQICVSKAVIEFADLLIT
jgi:hypothetical protein